VTPISSPINSIGIYVNLSKENAVSCCESIIDWLKFRDIRVFVGNDLEKLAEKHGIGCLEDEQAHNTDLLIVLGGDGTILNSARIFAPDGIPILGANIGTLGFLAEIMFQDLFPALEQIIRGDSQVEERMMLDVSVIRKDEKVFSSIALNDTTISRDQLSRIATLEVSTDTSFITTFNGDGLIISTPTGSTAHALSAGGPIIHPELDSFVLVPICPHALSNRPTVLPPDSMLKVRILNHNPKMSLTVDGQVAFKLTDTDKVVVKRSEFRTRLVRVSGRDFFEVLRHKLFWGERPGKI
jgi:NAD+ kinase